ncbi:MAG: sigma-70 family RNA polymerase sigma factor [Planctomycetaceae bacterium]|nr:sigma-70 family RNA polymerase sigma factor [Planctomycetaceae bacterium]
MFVRIEKGRIMQSPGSASNSENSQQATSLSLLLSARAQDPQAWERLVRIYTPLVAYWCRQAGLDGADTQDLTQEAFTAVVRGLPTFERDGQGQSFRGWLRTIVRHRLIDRFRAAEQRPLATGGTEHHRQLAQVHDPLSLDRATDEPLETGLVFRAAVDIIRGEFEALTAEAFWLTTVDSHSPADVATQLGITTNAVYKAKSRVLRRLREVLEGLE